MGEGHGIGWYLDGDEHGYQSVYHGGDGPGVAAFMRLFPSEDIAAVILFNTKCEELYDIQKAIFVALIPELAEPESDEPESPDKSSPNKIQELNDMYGTWRGQIKAYDRALDIELLIGSGGVRVLMANHDSVEADIGVFTPTFILALFDGDIPIPENERYEYRNRLAVVRDGDRLFGAVTSVGRRDDRDGEYELSSRVELRRSNKD